MDELDRQVAAVSDDPALDSELYAAHAEVSSLEELLKGRGTTIPALFNVFYKFVQNPSSVSVETFKRMVDTDDTVGSGVDFLTTCLAARLGRYQHPSQEVTKFVNDALDEIEGGFTQAVKEMLSSSWAGFSVTEKVWANTHKGFVPKRLMTLPPQTILFECERTGELTSDGILQYQRSYNPVGTATGVGSFFSTFGVLGGGYGWSGQPDPFAKLGDFPYPIRTNSPFQYLAVRIPRIKVIHHAFAAQGTFGNPYGRSLLRRAYKWYVLKDAFLQMLAIALDRKGTPLTIVFADQNTTLLDPNKATQPNMKGKQAGIRADVAASNAFKNIHNDSTIILPGKKGQVYETDFVPQASNAQDFMAAVDLCNKSFLRALLVPALIFSSGDGSGSYSLGQEHAKTFDKILDGWVAPFAHTLLQELIFETIAYNFPRSAWEEDGLGSFAKRELSSDEIQKEMEIVEKAVSVGAIDMNDLNDLNTVRDKIRFEPRETPIPRPDPMGGFGDEGGGPDPADADETPKE